VSDEAEETIEEMIQKMNDDLMAVGSPNQLKKKKKVKPSVKILDTLKNFFS